MEADIAPTAINASNEIAVPTGFLAVKCLWPSASVGTFVAPQTVDTVKAQNRTGLGMWANALYGAEMIAEAEKDAILQYLAATSPGTGPMLSETVPGWNQAVTADDLASEKYAEAGAS